MEKSETEVHNASRSTYVWPTVGAILVFVLAVFAVGEYIYGSRVDKLETDRDFWRARYDTLYNKTEGLFEPRLLYIDTMVRSNDLMWAHGGEVTFRLQSPFNTGVVSGAGYSPPPKIGLSYWNGVDSIGKDLLMLESGERWQYTVGNNSFYITLEILDPKQPKIVGHIYELKPIYKPPARE